MAEPLKVDLCVIGAGSGGLSVAAGASQMGASVVLVERDKMGGDCLNAGCVPSKALLAAAEHAHKVSQAPLFGVATTPPQVDFDAVRGHVRAVIDTIAPHDSVPRFEALGVTVLQETARFLDGERVQAGDQIIQARRFVIATGSRPFVPPFAGLDAVDYLTNEEIFETPLRGNHLLIVGGGPIGLEMAQAHRRLGLAVTVIEMDRALAKDDAEAAAIVVNKLRAEGIDILEGARVTSLQAVDGGIRVIFEAHGGASYVEGSDLLIAVGRRPNVKDLDLEAAGIAYDRGGITVDEGLRSSNRRAYAIGDVAGGLQFTHMAGYHAGIVIRNALFRLPAKASNRAIPWVTYTDPELAQVGLDEQAARAQSIDMRVLRWPFAENDRAHAQLSEDGFVKVITDNRGRILGATICGAHAGELIAPWVLAVQRKLKIKHMAEIVLPYPTLSEAGKRAAGSFFTNQLFSAGTRKLVRFLSYFG